MVDGSVVGAIGRGLLVLVGVTDGDGAADCEWLVRKLVQLRVFDDEHGVMNRSVHDVGGEVLAVSQFTLYASTRKRQPAVVHGGGSAGNCAAAVRCVGHHARARPAQTRRGRRFRRAHASESGQRRPGNPAARLARSRVAPANALGRIRPRWSRVPVRLWHELGLHRVRFVRRRHDRDAILVENIQDVPVQRRIHLRHAVGFIAADIDLVGHREITQCRLQHERSRFGNDARRAPRRLQQHGLHLPPWRLIADADGGVQQ